MLESELEFTPVAKEYLKKYPNEQEQAGRIGIGEQVYRSLLFEEKQHGGPFISPSDFSGSANFVKRWGVSAIEDFQHLNNFVYSKDRAGGDIYERRVYPPYSQSVFQTMRNTSIANQLFDFGHTYVGIGFVDLFQLVWGNYRYNSEDRRLKYYGFDANQIVTLRSKIIYGAMRYFTDQQISTQSLLQIWFSSCWDTRTLESFSHILKDALSNPGKYQLDQEDEPLICKWLKASISTDAAKREFSKGLMDHHFDDVWKMKFEYDRVKFCRYLFTGCIFVEENEVVIGNPTMFSSYNGSSKAPEELFFKAIDLTSNQFSKRNRNLNSLYDAITSVTSQTVSDFRSLVKQGKIICSLETKLIDPTDLRQAEMIKGLNPYNIDWSNVPDYMRKKEFIKFAKACSVEDTIHHVHFLNWIQAVYGACHVDWEHCQEKLMSYFKVCRETFKISEIFKENLPSFQSTFFVGQPFVSNINEINMHLSIKNRRKFEDYFLSDENGKVLHRFQSNTVDATLSSFFMQSHVMFSSAFTFNDEINF